MTPEQTQQLKGLYPGALHLKMGAVEMVVRMPTRSEWRRFKAMGLDETKRPDSVEQLLRDCCVFPEPTAVAALLEKRPALAEKFGAHLVKAAIGEEEVEATVF